MAVKPKDKRIVVRVDRCVGCHTCEIACALAHAGPAAASPGSGAAGSTAAAKFHATGGGELDWNRLHMLARGGARPGYRLNVEPYANRSVPIHCRHCDDAACLAACPTGAIFRAGETGPVLYDGEKCIGCRMCVQACPFGVISVDAQAKGVLKCDLCIERLADHLDPACVASCPTNALLFIEEREDNKAKRLRTAESVATAEFVAAGQSTGAAGTTGAAPSPANTGETHS